MILDAWDEHSSDEQYGYYERRFISQSNTPKERGTCRERMLFERADEMNSTGEPHPIHPIENIWESVNRSSGGMFVVEER